MSEFILDPNFKYAIEQSLDEFSDEFSLLCREVITTPRYWEDWVTSDPFRDIVDTTALDQSMVVRKLERFKLMIGWYTDYVTFVYGGYTLADGRRIPPREWVMLAIQENDILRLFCEILIKNLEK